MRKLGKALIVLSLVGFITHAYFVSYILENPCTWFTFVTGVFLFGGIVIGGALSSYE